MAPMTASRSGTNTPKRLTASPAQSSGSVMSSGRSCVSKSMKVSASSVHRSPHAATASQVGPNRHSALAARAPPRISTSG